VCCGCAVFDSGAVMAAAGPIAEVRHGVETGVAGDVTEAGPSVESRWSKGCVSIQSEVGVHGRNA